MPEQGNIIEAVLMKVWLPEQGGNKSVVSDSSDFLFIKHGNSAYKPPVTRSSLSLEVALSVRKFFLIFCLLGILFSNICQVPIGCHNVFISECSLTLIKPICSPNLGKSSAFSRH